ncbi:hypothetical protein DFH08DRAFT_918611 [Mycena albidolilacea]|uniref:Uncharacterized protein n=1 Tax=Mycena albidolilacea TaxID=1033008 RepID=A0AAD7EAQ6_9AGAR|nr:hypothetical protein DFH08DRAFT_918611 [Mycena albidolilacea]
MITCDNAGNNGTMMEQIQHQLLVLKIPFDSEGNRIRCFPHVINLAVKAGLAALVDLPIYSPDIYWDALMLDPVGAARKLVTAARASGQRDPPERLRVVGLLKDVETRWSATFLMVDRVLEQYLAIDKFLNAPEQEDISHHSFDAMTLRIFHLVQEIVSAEKTPTLSVVLPLYEKLIVMLNDLTKELGEISHAIKASVEKLEEYLAVSRCTKIYSLAMGEFRGDFP